MEFLCYELHSQGQKMLLLFSFSVEIIEFNIYREGMGGTFEAF